MTELTEQTYQEKKNGLTLAITLADNDVHSAAYRKSTGAGTAEQHDEAKSYAAQLRSELEDLESAWVGAQAAAKQVAAQKASDAHDAMRAEVERLLKRRDEVRVEALKAIVPLADLINEYDAISADVPRVMIRYCTDYCKGRVDDFQNIHVAAGPSIGLAPFLGSMLFFAGVEPSRLVGNRQLAKDYHADQLEDGYAKRTLAKVEAMAPGSGDD